MEKTYTVKQIEKYLLSQDSRGDILYNLSEENIDKANTPQCPECLSIVGQQELDTFGGLCEECTGFEG